MGAYKDCLMNKPDGKDGYGRCFVKRVTSTDVERSAYLQELKGLEILPDYFKCVGTLCKRPTRPSRYKPRPPSFRINAWEKRVKLQD